jgi:hypothetical protein
MMVANEGPKIELFALSKWMCFVGRFPASVDAEKQEPSVCGVNKRRTPSESNPELPENDAAVNFAAAITTSAVGAPATAWEFWNLCFCCWRARSLQDLQSRKGCFGSGLTVWSRSGQRDLFRGTFAPFSRASERPIAMACFRLLTRPPFPPLPERRVPFFLRRIALLTDLLAARPYLAISTS